MSTRTITSATVAVIAPFGSIRNLAGLERFEMKLRSALDQDDRVDNYFLVTIDNQLRIQVTGTVSADEIATEVYDEL